MKTARYRLAAEDITIIAISAIVALVMLVVTLYPIYYCLIYSLNEGIDARAGNLYLIPRKFTLRNYEIVFGRAGLLRSFLVTIARTVTGTLMGTLVTAMTAYALTKKRLVFRKFYSVLGIVTLYFSGGLIPFYLVLRMLGLLDSFWVYILPNVFVYFHALLFMAFFRELPTAIEESARIDGAGDFTIFSRIILPLSKPVVATIALFVGVGHWNDWFMPAFFVTDEKLMTLPVILMKLMNETQALERVREYQQGHFGPLVTVTPASVRYATLIVTVLPITMIYPFVQKYFIKGIMIGSVKA